MHDSRNEGIPREICKVYQTTGGECYSHIPLAFQSLHSIKDSKRNPVLYIKKFSSYESFIYFMCVVVLPVAMSGQHVGIVPGESTRGS